MRIVTAFLSLLATVSVAPALSGAAAEDLFTRIYNRGILKQRAITSIRADFVETTTSSLLSKPIVARGTVVAAPPGKVRMVYTEPEPKTLTMDGKTLVIAWANRPQREQIDIREVQKRVDHYFRDASIGELRSMFDITAAPDPAIRQVDRVEMLPRRKQIKQGLEKLELWIDRSQDMLVQLRMSFPGGDEKTIRLEHVTVNEPVDDRMFAPGADAR